MALARWSSRCAAVNFVFFASDAAEAAKQDAIKRGGDLAPKRQRQPRTALWLAGVGFSSSVWIVDVFVVGGWHRLPARSGGFSRTH